MPGPKIVSHIISCTFPKWGIKRFSIAKLRGGSGLRLVPLWIAGQSGVAVYSTLFKRNPKGPKIPFFVNVHAQIAHARNFNGRAMDRPTIPE